MSILPTHAYRSTPSPSATLPQNPNSDHGLLQPSPEPLGASSLSADLGSLQISDLPNGSIASAAADSGSSSKKVTEARTSNGKKIWDRQNHGNPSKFHQAGRGGLSSQLRYDSSGPVLADGHLPRTISSPHNRRTSDHGNQHASSAHPSVKKNQIMNGNHLLNFQYDPISRPQPRMPPPRKQQKIKPYNKDLFIQANYKFVVLDSGNNVHESMDPDKMLQWDNVVCVRYSTPQPVQCPICLESPLCPQITSCGHIFCFPCILRYLLMGAEDHKGDCWKKCPLCFMMISSKDLYTIKIENVKQYHIGDNIEFTLLSRAKDSLIPSQRSDRGKDVIACANVDLCDSFSKFTLASDVELSVREEISELSGWLARADSGLVDDLEQLPYVCAAMEQLEQRKKCWADLQTLSSSPPLKSYASPCSNTKACKYYIQTDFGVPASNGNADLADSVSSGPASLSPSNAHKYESKCSESSTRGPLYKEEVLEQSVDIPETFEVEDKLMSSSYDENKYMQKGSKDMQEKESYTFYQAIDGQHFILHPLNMKCLLHFYGSYDSLPPRIGGKILQLETVTQSEAMRRRFRYLSHFSLTTTFQLCEIDLSEILPRDALSPFMDEIKKRENQRKRIAKKEHMEKVKAEADALQAIPISSICGRSSSSDSMFTMDDFEALGSSSVSSTSPPLAGERKRFSDVTRLGFASAHDSPSLTAEEFSDATNTEGRSNVSVSPGQRNEVTLSFANIISAAKAPETVVEQHAKINGFGKKGKKPTRVLLSTSGGRRY